MNARQRETLDETPTESHARIFGFRREQDGRTFRALERHGHVKRVIVGQAPYQQSGWVQS